MFLALSEIRRNRTRFLLVAAIIALITTLLLFVSALAEGLGSGNVAGIRKIDAKLLVFQEGAKLSLNASTLPLERRRQVARVSGVDDVAPLGFSSATIPAAQVKAGAPLDVALVGVEPGRVGEPPAVLGRQLNGTRERSAVIDRGTQLRTGLGIGDTLILRTVQNTREELYDLTVVGVTDDRPFSLRPTVFVPLLTWDRVRPGPLPEAERDVIPNVLAVRVRPEADVAALARAISSEVRDVEVATLESAAQATPGFKEQQSTLSTQEGFTWLIGLLVVGVFFQIVTLQKVAQYGVLKAMGASNRLIVSSALLQMVVVTAVGVAAGSIGAWLLSLAVPATLPLVWPLNTVVATVASLIVMGPLGGLLSVRIILRVEPLTALGLAK